jgi:glycine cleavage system protein P-like pyridoxal-binding family
MNIFEPTFRRCLLDVITGHDDRIDVDVLREIVSESQAGPDRTAPAVVGCFDDHVQHRRRRHTQAWNLSDK